MADQEHRGESSEASPSASAPDYQRMPNDRRLYVPHPEGWRAHINSSGEKQYCFHQYPGQDYFHLILTGEIFLENGDEQICLNCALRLGVASDNRLYWQHVKRDKREFPL